MHKGKKKTHLLVHIHPSKQLEALLVCKDGNILDLTFPAVPVASLRFGDAFAEDMKIFNVIDASRQCRISRVNITTVLSSRLQVSCCQRHLTFRIPQYLNTSCFGWGGQSYTTKS